MALRRMATVAVVETCRGCFLKSCSADWIFPEKDSTTIQIAQPENVCIPMPDLIFRDIRIHGSLIGELEDPSPPCLLLIRSST
jgi:hypothetical protein